jgi:uncharacterized repeat protein (TIGR01451 family)
LIVLGFLPGIVLALESWPLSSQWIPLLDKDWRYYTDPQDFAQGSIDIVPDANGEAAYYWSTPTSLFLRFALRGSPLKNPSELVQYAWHASFDVNGDYYPDWDIMVGGITEALYTFYNPGVDYDVEAQNYVVPPIPKDGPSPIVSGEVRVVPAGYSIYPDMVYLDFQVPYTALQASGYSKNITYNTPFRMFYSSSTTESVDIKDAIGLSTTVEGAFANAQPVLPSGGNVYGIIYDTRDPAPYSNQGIWYRGEIVTVNGLGWPPSTSTYYSGGVRNVRIVNSSNTVVWSGTVTTGTDGSFNNRSTWTIGNSTLPGIYTIKVEDPRYPSVYNSYDNFEIRAPAVQISKSVNLATVSSGSNVTYTVTITNNGNATANLTTVQDLLPTGFVYVNNSSSGLTIANPAIAGQQLTWSGTWPLAAGNSTQLIFQAKSALSRGTFYNNVSVSGSNVAAQSTGNTAPVLVKAPELTLTKTVDKSNGPPGTELTYTINYANFGDDNTNYIIILETIPVNTTYVTGSASGTNTTVEYSHDNGVTYNSSQTPPVTHLKFSRTLTLTPSSNGSVSFKVQIK